MFWLSVLALLVAALALALWPLLRGRGAQDAVSQAVAFYEARKTELERRRAAGEISDADFEVAMAEQGRHLLVVGRGRTTHASDTGAIRRRKLAAGLMLFAVPAIALGLYLRLGQPGRPDLPLASRPTSPQNQDIATLIQRIEQHLARNPNDGRGYEVVAPVYLRSGRFADAAFAYRKVLSILGPTASRHADLGEALVAEKDGMITAEARESFEKSLALDPKYAKSQFYLALAREQEGDKPGALQQLETLAAGLNEGVARMRVEVEVERMRGELTLPPQVGPGSDAGKVIAALPDAERQAAIRGMVEQLDQRLTAEGGNPELWQRLVRARMVLQEPDKAREALGRARQALADNAEALKALEAMAVELGIPPAR